MCDKRRKCDLSSSWAALTALLLCAGAPIAVALGDTLTNKFVLGEPTPTGKLITPYAAKGSVFQDLNPSHATAPNVRAGYAVAAVVSPDGTLLAVQTSGYNFFSDASGTKTTELTSEYVLIYDVSGGHPKPLQVLSVPHTFQGLAWSPGSDRFFVSGGTDDAVIEFVRNGPKFTNGRTFQLGHNGCVGRERLSTTTRWAYGYYECGPETGGLDVSPDGKRVLVANLQNDSVSLIDLTVGRIVAEQDLRPGIIDPSKRGQPGGSFPRAVTWISADRAYVTSERDREIIALKVSRDQIRIARRTAVRGRPVALLANRDGSRLYIALDTTSQIAILDTGNDAVIEQLSVVAPSNVYANTQMLGGANTNALALTPEGRTLLVSNGGQNSLAVVRLSDHAMGGAEHGGERSKVVGLVPTGWYPTGVTISQDGATWYVVNSKSPMGPNASWCKAVDPARGLCVQTPAAPADPGRAENGEHHLIRNNQATYQLQRAGLLSLPAPGARELARLTRQVAHNNRFDQPDLTAEDKRLFIFLHEHIKHVIYIVKENRSYDQVLGDLKIGNGDPRLALYGEHVTPNHHAIARNFVTLDNFLVSGEASFLGWDWIFTGQTTDLQERAEPLFMRTSHIGGRRGLVAGSWFNRGLNMAYATSEERHARDPSSPEDPDILPGAGSVYAPDGPDWDAGKGTIWDAALRKGLSVRSYSVFVDSWLDITREPYKEKRAVAWATWPSLMPYVDPRFYGFTTGLADYWRVQEFKREFMEFAKKNSAPKLMLVSLHGDHTGSTSAETADGVNTAELQVADNDYALGLLIETIANSPLAHNTLIVSVEDNALDGPDHVSAQRSIVLLAGPYVRQGAVVSTRYTTVNVLKTIETILGIGPIGLNDAFAAPMSEVFDPKATAWSYKAIVPEPLRATRLPLPPAIEAAPRPNEARDYRGKR
jgi:DNA-binding beta-propeller fold protein YncE